MWCWLEILNFFFLLLFLIERTMCVCFVLIRTQLWMIYSHMRPLCIILFKTVASHEMIAVPHPPQRYVQVIEVITCLYFLNVMHEYTDIETLRKTLGKNVQPNVLFTIFFFHFIHIYTIKRQWVTMVEIQDLLNFDLASFFLPLYSLNFYFIFFTFWMWYLTFR